MPEPWWAQWRLLRVAHGVFFGLWPITFPILLSIGHALFISRRSRPHAWVKSALWSATQVGVPIAVLALEAVINAIDTAVVPVEGDWLLVLFFVLPFVANIAIPVILIRRRLSDRWVVITVAAWCTLATGMACMDIAFYPG